MSEYYFDGVDVLNDKQVKWAKSIRDGLKTTMSRVADDKSGRYLPAKLIGAIMSKRDAKPSNNLFWSDK